MRLWRIRWRCFDDGIPPGVYPVFDVFEGEAEQRLLRYSLSLGDEKAITVMDRFAPGASLLGDAMAKLKLRAIETAVLRLNVRRLGASLRAGLSPAADAHGRVHGYLQEEDVDLVVSMAKESKRCVYQLREDRDLLCSAASQNDYTKLEQRGLRILAPTTPGLCASCGMPEADLLCSHLMRPEVEAVQGREGVAERTLSAAMCALDRAEISSPNACRPGGNPCWERLVEEESARLHRAVGPLSIPLAVDHLDLAWRAWHGPKHRLFQHRSAEHLAGLTQPCTTRAELGQRLNELDSVLKSMTVPDHPAKPVDKTAGPLLRLEAYVEAEMQAGGLDPAELGRLSAAISRLRRVNDARVALEHPGAARVTPTEAFRELGLSWPLDDWAAAWDAVRHETFDALLVLAELIEPFSG